MNTPINPGEFNVELTIRLKTAGPYTVRLSGRRAIAAGLIMTYDGPDGNIFSRLTDLFGLYSLHKVLGVVLLALVLIRIGYRVTHGAPPDASRAETRIRASTQSLTSASSHAEARSLSFIARGNFFSFISAYKWLRPRPVRALTPSMRISLCESISRSKL